MSGTEQRNESYARMLELVDDLRNEVYILQELGEPTETVIDLIFDLEDQLTRII